MKRTPVLTFLCAALLLSSHSFAQQGTIDNTSAPQPKKDSMQPKLEFGLKLGLNMQQLTSDTWDQGYKPGVTAGITVGGHRKKLGVRAEVLIGVAGYKSKNITDSAGNTASVRATTISIPVMFEYSFIPALKVQIGPQYTNLISLKNTNDMPGDPKVLFKQSEFSGVLGLQVKLPAHFGAGARYIMGFSDINNNAIAPNDTWTNSTIQVYAVYEIQ